MGSGNDFAEVINLISTEFCCLVVDLPGHGKTEVRQDINYQMTNTAKGLIELLDLLEIKSCFLAGYSMGGRIALYMTICFPQYFRGVVLESASPGLKTQMERDRRIEQDLQIAKKLNTSDFSLFLAQWYGSSLFDSFVQHPNYPKAIATRLDNDPVNLAKSLLHLGLGMQPSLWNRLADNQVPILLVVGEFDSKFKKINQGIVNLCPKSCLKVIENSGHNTHFEQPQEFARLIKFFWQHPANSNISNINIKGY